MNWSIGGRSTPTRIYGGASQRSEAGTHSQAEIRGIHNGHKGGGGAEKKFVGSTFDKGVAEERQKRQKP